MNNIYRHKQAANLIRQGDVSLIACELPKGAKLIETVAQKVVAYGEQTGHSHTLIAEPETKFSVYEYYGNTYFKIDKGATITHPEHKVLVVKPGIYIQQQEREKDWFSLTVRKVVD